MVELAPGLWHWTAVRERIGLEVSSYYLQNERVIIDPMIPPEGLVWFDGPGAPEHAIMSNRHHDRDAWRLRDAFGCTVHCIRNGVHELEGRGPVEPFDFGDELPGGIVVYEVDAICPDETALHIPRHRALAVADGVVNWDGGEQLQFVPDWLMDDPEVTKQRLRDAYRDLLELDFDVLLPAHGDPLTTGGKQALREFVERAR
jgi:glyoxylase-like metal-dependent hydrolase (beta-lactamase superfamily II)